MSHSQKWTIAECDCDSVAELSRGLRVSPLLARCLAARGLLQSDKAKEFLLAPLSALPLPESLPGIQTAGDRIVKAVTDGVFISVFGDFDTDGITAAVIVHRMIEFLGGHSGVFFPDRKLEGYGFSPKAFERCLSKFPATGLIVTVDCGIVNADTCSLAAERGLSVIVTDHHEPNNRIPADADAVVDPHLPGTPEKMRNLCGAGVAFTLAHRLARSIPDAVKRAEAVKGLLPLAAVGTVADMVPLTGENRIIVKNGLKLINNRICPGINSLKKTVGINGKLSSTKIAFAIAPMMNAAGRIGSPDVAAALLESSCPETSEILAAVLNDFNRVRRKLEHEASAKAMEMAAAALSRHCHAVVLHSPDWHPGILGLVASRISKALNVPAIALSHEENGMLHGSARIPDHPRASILSMLSKCPGLIEEYGGHRIAAGLSISPKNLEKFKDAFDEAAKLESEAPYVDETVIDAEIKPADVTAEICSELNMLEPFGMCNPLPVFLLKNVTLSSDPVVLGRRADTWKFGFRELAAAGIMFHTSEKPDMHAGDTIDMAVSLSLDIYGAPELIIQSAKQVST